MDPLSFQFLDTQNSLFLLHGIKAHKSTLAIAYLCNKKRWGPLFRMLLPRDGMKILQWSSNPKLPSKNIPLPPRRDPGLFTCRQRVGCSDRGTSWRRTGSGRWEECSGAVYGLRETTDMHVTVSWRIVPQPDPTKGCLFYTLISDIFKKILFWMNDLHFCGNMFQISFRNP